MRWTAIGIALAGLACHGGGSRGAPAATESASAVDGASVYRSACASCHDHAVLRAPSPEKMRSMAPSYVWRALNDGLMKAQAASLDAAQRRAVAEYVTGGTIDESAPEVAKTRCAGSESDWLEAGAEPSIAGWGMSAGNTRSVAARTAGLPAREIPRLELAWAFSFPDSIRARSQPGVLGHALFVGSHSGAVYALDARTGCLHWRTQAASEVRTAILIGPDPGRRPGAPPRLYFGDIQGNVYAANAATGEVLWKALVADHPRATLTGSPSLLVRDAGDRLYVPVSSQESMTAADESYPCCTFRGSVAALDAASGEILWRRHTIPEPPARRGTSRVGVEQFGPSGASVWNNPTLDPRRGVLYFGTSQNYSSPADDNSDAVFAVDLEDGTLRWKRQLHAGDAWNLACRPKDPGPNCPPENAKDFDVSSSPMLIEDPGAPPILVVGLKSGDVFGIDPDANGRVVWHRKLGRGGLAGGVHFGMAATGRVAYVPINDETVYEAREHWSRDWFPGPVRPGVYALDAHSGEVLWSSPLPDPCNADGECLGYSAALTAVPGAVFAAVTDGRLRALDAATGKLLWEYDTRRTFTDLEGRPAHGGAIDGPGAVVAGGRVYVNSGYLGMHEWTAGNVLLAFAPPPGPR